MKRRPEISRGDPGPFSGKDRERCGFIEHEFVVACRYCDHLHRYAMRGMERKDFDSLVRHLGDDDWGRPARCKGCGRQLRDVEYRKISPRASEIEAMRKAAVWMTNDKGRPPTPQELWRWLELNPVPPDPRTDGDNDFDDE